MAKEHIKSLDALRGIGAVLVCLFHAQDLFSPEKFTFLNRGFVLVDLFFVFSGFLLVYHYQPMILAKNGLSFRNLAILRFARIYPAFLAATLLGAAFSFLHLYLNGNLGPNFTNWLSALVFNTLQMPYFFSEGLGNGSAVFPFAIQAWSVFWELVASILFYFWVVSKNKFKNWISIVFCVLLVLAIKDRGTIDGGWQKSDFHIGGLRAFTGTAIGMLTGMIYDKYANQMTKFQKNLTAILAIISSILLLSYVCTIGTENNIINIIFIMIIFPIIIFGYSFVKSPIITNKAFMVLGAASYSLYVTHTIIIEIINAVVARVHWLHPSPALGIASMVMMIGIGYAMFVFFENPMRVLIKKAMSKKAAKPIPQNSEFLTAQQHPYPMQSTQSQ